ncbi:aBC-type antimicrobial peptide transport system permease component [Clostridium sp. CAG:149]|nr:aBC-type antimicrobial peptide transport system permease component [Clostridium sp. CAG:149]
MRFLDLLIMSVNNLRRRKLRTFLTVLGVVIGTASIVVMVSLGIGLNNFTMENIRSSGSLTAIEIYNYQNMNGEDVSEDKFMTDETIKSFAEIPHVTSVYPMLTMSVLMKQGAYEGYVTMTGVPLDFMKDIPLGKGSRPSPNAEGLEMVVGNMVARNFSNSKTGKGYWDTGEEPDVDFMNRPMFVIFDMNAYYQSQSGGTGADGENVQPPKKYMLNTAALVEGGPEDYNEYSYSVYVDLEKLKAQLKQVFKKDPIPGQPTNKKGKPYPYFIYEQAVVNVDDMDNVKEVQQQLITMGYEASSRMDWLEPYGLAGILTETVQYGSGCPGRNRGSVPVRRSHRHRQHHDDVHLREDKRDRRAEGTGMCYGKYPKHVFN